MAVCPWLLLWQPLRLSWLISQLVSRSLYRRHWFFVQLVILCPRIISSLIQVFRGIYEWSWGLCQHSPLLSVVLYRGQIPHFHFSLQYFDISWKNRHCYLYSGRIFILSLASYAAPPFFPSPCPSPPSFLCVFDLPVCAWMCVNKRARQGWQIMKLLLSFPFPPFCPLFSKHFLKKH